MFNRVVLALVAGMAACSAASCSSGGGNVTGNNPLNPTTAPSGGAVSSPSPIASGAPAASPTATTAGPTPTPTTAGSSPSPSPTASVSLPVATPTATATSTSSGGTGLATTCSTSSAGPVTMTYTLPGTAETIQLPNYPSTAPYQITGSSDVPTQSPSGTVLTVELSQNSFSNGTFVTPSGKTDDVYATLEENTRTTFGSGSTSLLIPVTINSPCIVSGRTYTVDEASSGLSIYTETDTPTTSGTVTGHIEVSLNPFPANTVVNITFSH